MCRITYCQDRRTVREKKAAHNYYDQLREFYNLSIKQPKKRKKRWKYHE